MPDEARTNTEGKADMPRRPKHGFKEYVKNPDLLREESEFSERLEAAPPPTRRKLAALISTMGQRPLEYDEIQQLEQAGETVVPALEEALRNKAFQFKTYGESALDGSALETALDLLEPFALPAASLLEPALNHQDEHLQCYALCHLARCGNDDAIEALRAGLKSPSDECRQWTLMGLEFLKDSPRASKNFRSALFQACLPLLQKSPTGHEPKALLALDSERAVPVLLGEDVLNAKNRSVYKVLEALKDANIPVPAPRVRKLLATIKSKAKKFPFDYAYAEGLILLARTEGAGARDVIDDAQVWGNDEVREGAAKALVTAAGVENAYEFVIDLYQRDGASGLTPPQLHYLTLVWLDAEVRNGGFSQYYFNSSGELASHAVKAAQSVGAAELAKIIQEANALFGQRGPDPDRDARMDQLSRIELEKLDDLDARYYQSTERLSEILPKFVANNPDAFRVGP